MQNNISVHQLIPNNLKSVSLHYEPEDFDEFYYYPNDIRSKLLRRLQINDVCSSQTKLRYKNARVTS